MINPKVHYCRCGMTWTPGILHKIIMLVCGGYSWRCPRCHTVLRFKFIGHVVKTEINPIKDRDKVYKNG